MKSYFLLSAVLLAAYAPLSSFATTLPMVGGDRDAHGCIGSAGYVWSAPMGQCIRTWEHYDMKITPPNTGNAKLDTFLQKRSDRVVSRFRRDAELQLADTGMTTTATSALDISYTRYGTGRLIVLSRDVYTFLGGAHGISDITTYNYDPQSDRFLSLRSVVSPKDLGAIARKSQAYFSGALDGYTDAKWLRAGLAPKYSNYQNYIFHTDATGKITGITFFFESYQIASYAAGQPIITFRLRDLSVLSE